MNPESNADMNDDVTFYMQGWEPDGKSKAIVCLLHGLGEHTGRYAHVGRALSEAGYALFGFDLRGHGRSGGPRGHFPSLDVVMQDVYQFVQFQKQNNPRVPLFLYGHSLGGLLALTYAIHYPDGIKGVISSGTSLRSALQEQKLKILAANVLGSLIPAMTIPSGLEVSSISRDPNVITAYINDPLVHEKASLGFGKAALTAIDLCFARAKELTPPLLMMHGKMDRLAYPSGSENFAKLAGETNKDVTLKVWDGLYHEIHNEPEKAEVFKTMIEWMNVHL